MTSNEINELCNAIDIKAGSVREYFITSVPGQEATYFLKYLQALDYKSRNYADPVPLMIQAEAAAQAVNYSTSADNILLAFGNWEQLAALIEKERLTAKRLLKACVNDPAATTQTILNIYHNGIGNLSALLALSS